MRVIDKVNQIGEGEPAETLFGFTPWSHMIPPFKPNDTLILGERAETIAALIRKVWGPELAIISGEAPTKFNFKFDFICLNLWEAGQPAKVIFLPTFAVWLKELFPHMICANIPKREAMRLQRNFCDHGPFQFERGDLVGENAVLWWSTKCD